MQILAFILFNPWTVIAIACSVFGYFTLINLKRKSGKPFNHVPWLIFLVVIGLILAAEYHSNEVAAVNVAYVIGLTGVLLFTKGTFKMTLLNGIVLAIAGVAMVLWYLTTDLMAITMSLVAVVVATIPLWKALINDPGAEPRLVWAFFALGSVAELFANGPRHTWKLNAVLPVFVYFGQQLSVLALGARKRRWRSRGSGMNA